MLFRSRWEAGEQNRVLFEYWESAQLALGMALFFLLLFGSTESQFSLALVLTMVCVVILERFVLTPMLIGLGRLIDFVPPKVYSPDRVKFGILHSGYAGLEIIKWLVGLGLAVKMMRRGRHSGKAAGNVDVVDESYHRHINR